MFVWLLLFTYTVVGDKIKCQHISTKVKALGVTWDKNIPWQALGICFTRQRSIGKLEIRESMRYDCDENGNITMKEWKYNTICDGDFDYSDPFTNPTQLYDVYCMGGKCPYALVKQYESVSCEAGRSSLQYIETPYIVNYCIERTVSGLNHSSLDGKHYMSLRCTDSRLEYQFYDYKDCSGPPIAISKLYENGKCMQNQMIYGEIIYCDTSNDMNYILIRKICIGICAVLISICLFICIWLTYKIFSNMYEFEKCYVICYKITFSDRHTWITEPSELNKIYALSATMCYSLTNIMHIFVLLGLFFKPDFNSHKTWRYFQYFLPNIFINGAQTFFYCYMVSTLQYYMESDEIIRVVISQKLLKCIKICIIFGIVVTVLDMILFIFTNNLYPSNNYDTIIKITVLIKDTFIQMMISYLYYSGLNNLCHYWYSKQWKEYDKYGENERIHEILITITRTTVTIFFSATTFVAYLIMNGIIAYMLKINYTLTIISMGFTVISLGIICIINTVTIYFVYPFSHTHYEKVCNRCHNRLYKRFQKKHNKQVLNGGFDGKNNKYKKRNVYELQRMDVYEIVSDNQT